MIVLAAVLAIVPQMVRGNSCGHDFDFHLVSWLDALGNWRHGLFYPHWTASANYGAGEPRFIFYPPLTWMLGAAMGIVLPWKIVPLALTSLLLAAAGLATRTLAREKFDDAVATLAGCTTVLSGYALFTAYERSAFAELTGGFWFPLMLLFALRNRIEDTPSDGAKRVPLVRRAFDGSALLLTLVVAGAWLSNAPVGVMLCYTLAAVALTTALLGHSWAPLLRAATAVVLGIGLSAFYLVPAAWEQRWVAIQQATDDPGLLIENSWLFARHGDPRLEQHDIELLRVSGIAVTMIAVALAGLLVTWWRKRLPAERKWWIPLGLVPVAVLFLQLPFSRPIWNLLPELRFLQFPWRWLVALGTPMAIFFASALWTTNRWLRAFALAVCAFVFLAAVAIAGVSFYQGCETEDSVRQRVEDYRAGTGFEGTDEYAPPHADNTLVAMALPIACFVNDPTVLLGQGDPDVTPLWSADQHSCEATFPAAPSPGKTPSEHLAVAAETSHAGYLVLRQRTYPAWDVRVNGVPVTQMPERQDGLMAVPVPRGHVKVNVDWTATRDFYVGRLISGLAALLVTGLGLLEYRRFRPRLS
ncbi:MAG TPA: hypothetical protein VGG85_08275 [Terracidiphilus sp.]